MKDQLPEIPEGDRSAKLRRHQAQCSVCQHPQCQEIEEAWVNWESTTLLAQKCALSRDAIYRHTRVLGLVKERSKRLRFLLEKVLERADTIVFSGGDFLKAFQLYTADLEREEAKQASALASQEASRPVSDQEAEVLAEDEPLPEKGTSDSLEGEAGGAAEGHQEGEQGATPVPSQDGQNPEPPASVTVQ